MNHLGCNVTTCASNDNSCCCRPSIQVAGDSARASVETCCDSFAPCNTGASNDCGCHTPNPSLEIDCGACHCKYNKNHKCTSTNVQIEAGTDGTECKTFAE